MPLHEYADVAEELEARILMQFSFCGNVEYHFGTANTTSCDYRFGNLSGRDSRACAGKSIRLALWKTVSAAGVELGMGEDDDLENNPEDADGLAVLARTGTCGTWWEGTASERGVSTGTATTRRNAP